MIRVGRVTKGLSEEDRARITAQALESIAKIERYEEKESIIPDRIAAIFATNELPVNLYPPKVCEKPKRAYKEPQPDCDGATRFVSKLDPIPLPSSIHPLHDAIFYGNVNKVRTLLTDITLKELTCQDLFGDTALGLAIKFKRPIILKLIKAKMNTFVEHRIYA